MRIRPFFLLFALFSVLGACSRAAPQFEGKLQRTEPWDPAFVTRMAELPVQSNGRVKPLATFASFLLYEVHGRRDMKFQIGAEKHRLEPVEWLLDVWCYPEQAADYPLFRIENVGVLDALGIDNDGQKLSFVFLSYRSMISHAERLEQLGRDYGRIDQKNRNAVQDHIVHLYNQVLRYYGVHEQMRPMRDGFRLEGEAFRKVFGGKESVPLAEIVRRIDDVRAFVKGLEKDLRSEEAGNAAKVLQAIEQMSRVASGPSLIPPAEASEKEWLSPLEVPMRALLDDASPEQRGMFTSLADAVNAADQGACVAGLEEFREAVVAAAGVRGENDKVSLEAQYYRENWHFHGMFCFVAGFLIAVMTWLVPRKSMAGRLLWLGAMGFTVLGLGLLTYDITLRCLITSRPPIKNLYDTFLFISALCSLTCLVVEWIMRTRIALALGPFAGAMLIMFARMFEVSDGKDTMDPLMAVLDSNYWLATHVTTVNIGYAAGLAAAVLANAWIAMRVLRLGVPSDSTMKGLVRAVYGVTCFSLLLSLFGTIYGGVWANESWGRFWGWDPKENGALMICVSQTALLHARWCGWVRDFGTILWASFTGMIVLFSWFHTNLLGVGLHTYGFSSGLRNGVWTGYAIEVGFMLVGAIDVWLRPNPVAAVAGRALKAATGR